MMSTLHDAEIALAPVNFFPLRVKGRYCEGELKGNKYLLPDTSALCNQTSFAKVSFGWNEKGVLFVVDVHKKAHTGDKFEVFLDTRDVKTASFNTRFCHHFFCFPEPVEGVQAAEITRFRTEDAHELCDPEALQVKTTLTARSYKMALCIPQECLVGYDPEQFKRLGMTYRMSCYGGEQQEFSVTTSDYQVDQQPSLWSSVRLIR